MALPNVRTNIVTFKGGKNALFSLLIFVDNFKCQITVNREPLLGCHKQTNWCSLYSSVDIGLLRFNKVSTSYMKTSKFQVVIGFNK